MAEILLVNPRKRRTRRKKTATRRRRPAARRKAPARRRRRNPAPPGTARKRARRRRYRKNPALNMRSIQGLARTAAAGAGGALALDVALAYIPLPANLKTGVVGKVVKGLGAIALGAAAKNFKLVNATTARDMTVGALTVQFTGIGRDLLAQFAPGVALSAYMDDDGLGYVGSGWNPSASLDWSPYGNGLNAYVPGGEVVAPGYGQPGMDNGYDSSLD